MSATEDKETTRIHDSYKRAHKKASQALAVTIAKLVLEEAEGKSVIEPEAVTGIIVALIDGARMVIATVPHEPSKERLKEVAAERIKHPFKGVGG